MADANLTVTTLEATAFDKLRVPEAFEAAPVVAVVLPSCKYVELISSQQQRSFTYVLLEQSTYNMTDPLSFDADSFVEAVLAWSSGKKVDAFMAFDCFPTLLASVVNEALKLPGPSFRSVFCCSNKHYTRRWLAPELAIALPPAAPSQFPCVVKVSDTQFYVGTRICLDAADYPAKCAELQDGLLKSGAAARQAFCFKWASRFGWADKVGWTAPADIVLVHTEPFLECVGEYQAEVVVEADGSIDVADTGDIEHGPGGCITVFKAPGTFTLTSKLRAWMKEKVVEPLVALGYRSAAMDIEFVRLQGEEEAYELIEINSRYSYMGNYLHFGHAAEATIGKQMHNTLCESQHADIKEVRAACAVVSSTAPRTLAARSPHPRRCATCSTGRGSRSARRRPRCPRATTRACASCAVCSTRSAAGRSTPSSTRRRCRHWSLRARSTRGCPRKSTCRGRCATPTCSSTTAGPRSAASCSRWRTT